MMSSAFQSLAGIARMPYAGTSTTRTTTTTITTTTTTTVKPKLTLSVLTDYLAQLDCTPITPRSNVEEPSSTTAECGGEATPCLSNDPNNLGISAAARANRVYDQRWDPFKEEDETRKDADDTAKSPYHQPLPQPARAAATAATAPSPEHPQQSHPAIENMATQLLHDRVTQFLQSFTPNSSSTQAQPHLQGPPVSPIRTQSRAEARLERTRLQENRNLQKQVASLQRSGQALTREKQALIEQVGKLQREHEAVVWSLKDDLAKERKQKEGYEARIRELEELMAKREDEYRKQMVRKEEAHRLEVEQRLAKQKEEDEEEMTRRRKEQEGEAAPLQETVTAIHQLMHMGLEQPTMALGGNNRPPRTVSDAEITTWFQTRSQAWHSWAETYAHASPSRIKELHPVQMDELCKGVSHFVRLNDGGKKLPAQFLDPSSRTNKKVQTLLCAMLSNFVTTSCLQDPFWLFKALDKRILNDAELESPTEEYPGASDEAQGQVAGLPDNVDDPVMSANLGASPWQTWQFSSSDEPISSPAAGMQDIPPVTARSMTFMSPRHAPPTFASMGSLAMIAASTHEPGVVKGGRMEKIRERYELPTWEQVVGLCEFVGDLQPSSAFSFRTTLLSLLSQSGDSHTRQQINAARRNYARKLKDQFLSGPARFLLANQSFEGIDQLEAALEQELDACLEFSTQLWVQGDLSFKGLGDLKREDINIDGVRRNSEVAMVLQPAITITSSTAATATGTSAPRILTPASVLLSPSPAHSPSLPASPSLRSAQSTTHLQSRTHNRSSSTTCPPAPAPSTSSPGPSAVPPSHVYTYNQNLDSSPAAPTHTSAPGSPWSMLSSMSPGMSPSMISPGMTSVMTPDTIVSSCGGWPETPMSPPEEQEMLPAAVYKNSSSLPERSKVASRRRTVAPGGLTLGSSSFDGGTRRGGAGRSGWMKVEG